MTLLEVQEWLIEERDDAAAKATVLREQGEQQNAVALALHKIIVRLGNKITQNTPQRATKKRSPVTQESEDAE